MVDNFVALLSFTLLLTGIPYLTEGGQCFQCSTRIEGIECYTLKDNGTSTNANANPDFVVECSNFCVIRREELADEAGGVYALNRSCEDEYQNYVIENGYFISFVRSCNYNLCNFGDGLPQFIDLVKDEDWNLTIPMSFFEVPVNRGVSYLNYYFHNYQIFHVPLLLLSAVVTLVFLQNVLSMVF